MIFPTHSVFGLFFTLILLSIFGIKESLHWTILLAGVLGAVMPDIDISRSLVGRVCFFVSIPLERKFGHRSVSHSLLGWLVASIIFAIVISLAALIAYLINPVLNPLHLNNFRELSSDTGLVLRWIGAFSSGYLSHIILDMFTSKGVPLFWPDPTRDTFFKSNKLHIETGSKSELGVFAISIILLILAFPISQYGLTTSLRWLLATPESTIAEYKTQTTRTYIEFRGYWTQTKPPISGWAEILDVQNKRLIIRLTDKPSDVRSFDVRSSKIKNNDSTVARQHDSTIVTLSDELTADIIAKAVHFHKTKLPIKSKQITFKDQSRESLLTQISDTDLISGTIDLPTDLKVNPSDVSTFDVRSIKDNDSTMARQHVGRYHVALKSITQKNDQLILTFATKKELKSLSLNSQYEYQLQSDQLALKQTNQKISRLQKELKTAYHPNDGLTDLGRKTLGDPDKAKREKKIQTITQELEELTLQREGLLLKLQAKALLFSGAVWVRE